MYLTLSKVTSLKYLQEQLPRERETYAWAPNLYGSELAHIDAIDALAKWAADDNRSDAGLTDVLNRLARAHGWTDPDGVDAKGDNG